MERREGGEDLYSWWWCNREVQFGGFWFLNLDLDIGAGRHFVSEMVLML